MALRLVDTKPEDILLDKLGHFHVRTSTGVVALYPRIKEAQRVPLRHFGEYERQFGPFTHVKVEE